MKYPSFRFGSISEKAYTWYFVSGVERNVSSKSSGRGIDGTERSVDKHLCFVSSVSAPSAPLAHAFSRSYVLTSISFNSCEAYLNENGCRRCDCQWINSPRRRGHNKNRTWDKALNYNWFYSDKEDINWGTFNRKGTTTKHKHHLAHCQLQLLLLLATRCWFAEVAKLYQCLVHIL